MICTKHKIFRLIDKLKDYSVNSLAMRLFWVFIIQHKRFADVVQAIVKKQQNGLQKQLGLIPNELGILTCHGRFLNVDMSEDAKYPSCYHGENNLLDW